MRFVAYPDRDMLALELASELGDALVMGLDHEDRVLLAVPGGSTPGPVFDLLRNADLDWSRVDVTLTDERWVPPDHPRSNTRLLKERLLVDRAEKAQLLHLYQPVDTPEDALETVAQELNKHLPISVLVLGMGEDMHTASLFPGAAGLDAALQSDAPTVVAMHPDDQEPRISLSAPALNGALSKTLLITGEDKRAALEKAKNLPAAQAPVAAILDGTTVHWAP